MLSTTNRVHSLAISIMLKSVMRSQQDVSNDVRLLLEMIMMMMMIVLMMMMVMMAMMAMMMMMVIMVMVMILIMMMPMMIAMMMMMITLPAMSGDLNDASVSDVPVVPIGTYRRQPATVANDVNQANVSNAW